MATTWTRADYEAATAHDDAIRARDDARAQANLAELDAAFANLRNWRTPTEVPRIAEARGLDALAPTPTTPIRSPYSPSLTKAHRGLAEARTDLYDAQTAARAARYAVTVAKATRLRATATLAVVRATEAEARLAHGDQS